MIDLRQGDCLELDEKYFEIAKERIEKIIGNDINVGSIGGKK